MQGYGHDIYQRALEERVEDIIADRLRLRPNAQMIVGSRADALSLYSSQYFEKGSYVDLVAFDVNEPSECTKIAHFWSLVDRYNLRTSQITAVIKRFQYDRNIKDVPTLSQTIDLGCDAIEKARLSHAADKDAKVKNPWPVFTAPFFHAQYISPRLPSVGGGSNAKNPYVARLQKIEAEIAEAYLLAPPIDEADGALQRRRAGLAYRRAISEEINRQATEGFELASDIKATRQTYNNGMIEPAGEWTVRSVSVKLGDLVRPNQHVLTWRRRDYAELAIEFDGSEFSRIAAAERLKPLAMYVAPDPSCAGAKGTSLEGEIITFERLAGGGVRATIAVATLKPAEAVCHNGTQQSLGSLPRNGSLTVRFIL